MTYEEEEVKYQNDLYLKGQYVVVHQEHDDIRTWYCMPSTKDRVEKEQTRRDTGK